MSDSFINNLNKNTEAISTLLKSKEYSDIFDKVVDLSISSLKNGGSIYIAGNGGSASQADHFAGELVGRFFIEGKSLKVYSLSANTTVITCIANDFSFDEVFSQQLSGQLEEKYVSIFLEVSIFWINSSFYYLRLLLFQIVRQVIVIEIWWELKGQGLLSYDKLADIFYHLEDGLFFKRLKVLSLTYNLPVES